MPGYASDMIADLLWERRHGAAKRVATAAALIVQQGWMLQKTLAGTTDTERVPHLTAETGMVLVDEALKSTGSTAVCTREEVEAAFEWLTSPLVGAAVRENDGIVIVAPDRVPLQTEANA